jgi:PAS domain S-box-containing protein
LRIRGQQLEETEFRWKFALEGAGDGVWDWNMGTGTVYYSPRWKQMLGWEDTEIGTTPEECTERVHPEDVGARQQAIDDYLNGRAAQYVAEFRMRCKDGDYKWILARGIAVSCDATGRPNRLIGTHTDITERKRAEHGACPASRPPRGHWCARAPPSCPRRAISPRRPTAPRAPSLPT